MGHGFELQGDDEWLERALKMSIKKDNELLTMMVGTMFKFRTMVRHHLSVTSAGNQTTM